MKQLKHRITTRKFETYDNHVQMFDTKLEFPL